MSKKTYSAFGVVLIAIAAPAAYAQTVTVTSTQLLSRTTTLKSNGDSRNPEFSADGKRVVFESAATNLVTGDTNLRTDIFIKTLATGAVTRVSSNGSGVQANDDSGQPVFSPDGTKVAFRSFATNLVSGGGFQWHIYVKNLTTGAVTRVSTSASGVAANGFCYNPVFSHNGQMIAFESDATNLAPGDDGLHRDIYVKNLGTGAVARISSDATGIIGNGDSANPVFSPDDKRMAFDSGASNLVKSDTNGFRDVFVKTLSNGFIKRFSTSSTGRQGDGHAGNPAFSPDGLSLAFWADGRMGITGDGNNTSDIFIKNMSTGALTRISNNANGTVGNTTSINPTFSPNGHSVAFVSLAGNLVPGDKNNFEDIFIKQLGSTAIARVSVTPTGSSPNGRSWTQDATGKSYRPVFNAFSNRIVFPSAATNLVSGDTNTRIDVFMTTFTGN